MKPLVEIIVLHHDGLENIKKCLDSLKKIKYPNLIVRVVDQLSRDGTIELIETKYKWAKLVVNKKNYSFAEANNRILKKSKAKYCILLNDDTIVDSTFVMELVNVAEKNKDAATLQPKVLSLKNKKIFEYAGAAGGHIDIFSFPVCRGRIYDSIEKDVAQYEKISEIFWSCGVALFLRMDVIREIGMLDEDIGTYGEEVDLCWRINLAGYKQLYVPKSIIYHLGSATWAKTKFKAKKQFLIHKNQWIMLAKNYSAKSLSFILPSVIFLDIIAFFAFLIGKPHKSMGILNSFIWAIANIMFLIKKSKENLKIREKSDREIMKKMIKTSTALQYYLLGKKEFKDYLNYIEYEAFKHDNI